MVAHANRDEATATRTGSQKQEKSRDEATATRTGSQKQEKDDEEAQERSRAREMNVDGGNSERKNRDSQGAILMIEVVSLLERCLGGK
jgi:hypothetical protein